MFKLLKNMKKKNIIYVLISVMLICLQVFLDLRIPEYMSSITKLITTGGTTNEVISEGIKMLLCAVFSLGSAFIVGYIAALVGANFGKITRSKVFEKVTNFGVEENKKFKTSSLITRTTNDVTQVQTLISLGLQMLIKAPITAVWTLLKILDKNMSWTLLTFGILIALIIVVAIIMVLAIPRFKKIQKLTDDINRVSRENLTGVRVVRAFNAEEYEENKFENVNGNLTKINLYVQNLMAFMMPYMTFMMSILTLGIYYIGAVLINEAEMINKFDLFSDMVVFSSYSIQLIMSFMMLIVVFILYPRASVSAKRINEVLNVDVKIKNTKNEVGKEVGTIKFNNVTFRYKDAKDAVLDNLNFEIKKGETVAFIGSTGSGKSTLINLITRFYDVTNGNVLVDGVDVRNYKQSVLRKKIGYISQKAVLFKGSIRSNLIIGDNEDLSDLELNKILKVAQADFVDDLDKEVSQGGTNFSGGQKQRLNIARAIARKPEIYIFDDSFSALDYKTDANLRNALKKYEKDATILIVAQRIGTIKNADKIIVLDNGKIVGIGKHKELIKNCDVYKEIASSQLSKEELDA